MADNKIIINGVTRIDLTGDDVTTADVNAGIKFHLPDGTQGVGTGSGAFIITLSHPNIGWETDKTFAQITDAYNAGKTLVTKAYDPTTGNELQTSCGYVTSATPNYFEYAIYWYDSSNSKLLKETYKVTESYSMVTGITPYEYPKTLVQKTITANGTYDPATDSADGYSAVTVNVSGGGGASSWTKVAETSYQVTYSNTSSSTVATWATGHSELWTSDKWVYVRVRDTEGKRNGYFYGSDQFFYNIQLANGATASSDTNSVRMCTRYNDGRYITVVVSATTGYGVFADTIYSDGRIRVRKRYNSTNSLTVDSTYKVEVYLLDPAGGVPIFT